MDTCYKHMGWYGHDYLQWFGKKLSIKKQKFTQISIMGKCKSFTPIFT
jgi:hypothetical protein